MINVYVSLHTTDWTDFQTGDISTVSLINCKINFVLHNEIPFFLHCALQRVKYFPKHFLPQRDRIYFCAYWTKDVFATSKNGKHVTDIFSFLYKSWLFVYSKIIFFYLTSPSHIHIHCSCMCIIYCLLGRKTLAEKVTSLKQVRN